MTNLRRAGLAAAVILFAAPFLTGCAPALQTAAPTGISPSPSASLQPVASTPPAAPTPSSSSTTAPPPPPPPPPPSGNVRICDTTSFTIAYIAQDGSAGKQHGILTFRNKSGAPCEAHGFPTAAFMGSDGRQVGAHSSDDGVTPTTKITVPNGQSLVAPITFSDADLLQDCTVVQVTKLSVSSPEASNSVVITIPETDACASVTTGLITVGAASLG